MDENFFRDPKAGISDVMGILLYRQNVVKVAGFVKQSTSLVYAWVNPGQPQIPNMEQFSKCIEYVSVVSEAPNPTAVRTALQKFNQFFGFKLISDTWLPKAKDLRALAAEIEGGPHECEMLAYPPVAQRRPLLRAMIEEAAEK